MSRCSKKNKFVGSLLFTLAASCLLAWPTLAPMFDEFDSVQLNENRRLADFGDALKGGLDFRERHALFKKAIKDQFGGRRRMVREYGRLCVNVLGFSPSLGVLVGKDGWYYRRRETETQYQGIGRFTDDELAKIAQSFVDAKQASEGVGAKFYVVMTRGKAEIYPEYLPNGYKSQLDRSISDNFLAYMRQHTNVKIIDTRDALMSSKRGHQLFFKTDLHWTPMAGFYSSRLILNEIAQDFPNLELRSTKDYHETTGAFMDGGLMTAMGLHQAVTETVPIFRLDGRLKHCFEGQSFGPYDFSLDALQSRLRVAGGPKNAPTLAVIRNSFGSHLIPYLSDHFLDPCFYWPRGAKETVAAYHEALATNPDVVIHQIHEADLFDWYSRLHFYDTQIQR